MKYQTEMRMGIALLLIGFVMQTLLIAANLDRVEAGGIVKSMTPTPTRTITATRTNTPTLNFTRREDTPPLPTATPTDEGLEFPEEQCLYLICIKPESVPPNCPIPPPVTLDLLCKNIWTPTPGGN